MKVDHCGLSEPTEKAAFRSIPAREREVPMQKLRLDHSGGISANRMIVPIIVLLAICHVIIIGLIVSINSASTSLSRTMQNSGTYIEDATSLLAGSSLLSETCTNFVLMPLDGNGDINVSPLVAYANELNTDRRGSQVLEKFSKYSVSQEAMDDLTLAAGCADSMMQSQLHAMALISAVYPIPNVTPLDTLPLPELTAEEKAYPDEQKLGAARSLVLGPEYGLNKQAVSNCVGDCTRVIKTDMGQLAAETSRHIAVLRTAMWVMTSAIILLIAFTFVVLYRQLVIPLGGFVRLIRSGNTLDEDRGLQEVRMLATAYNDLLSRRDSLMATAETDSLTGLPNRYSFEQYTQGLGEEAFPLALVLFDVNFLKHTNDTYGHSKGDELLRMAASCISDCFGSAGKNKCFRFGGDEFAAVVTSASPEIMDRMGIRFREEQEKRNLSIAWGCAFAEKPSVSSFHDLSEQADKEMYDCKKDMHLEEILRDPFQS